MKKFLTPDSIVRLVIYTALTAIAIYLVLHVASHGFQYQVHYTSK